MYMETKEYKLRKIGEKIYNQNSLPFCYKSSQEPQVKILTESPVSFGFEAQPQIGIYSDSGEDKRHQKDLDNILSLSDSEVSAEN